MRPRLPSGKRFPGLIAVAAAGVLAVALFAGDPVRSSMPEADVEPTGQETRPPGTIDRPRVMLVGDSLTQGSSGDVTWRYRLWRHLRAYGADFVGPYRGLYDNVSGEDDSAAYASPASGGSFDGAHLAAWNAYISNQIGQIGRQVVRYRPHYLLILTGRDDIIRGASHEAMIERTRDLVIASRVVRGDLRFVIGRLPQSLITGQARHAATEIAEFNAELPKLAAELSVPESPVAVAATDQDFTPVRDTWDGTHANRRGELKIAAGFADALAESFTFGHPYPRPLPKVEVGPRWAPTPSARPLPGGASLRWPAVPGATGYWVWMRAPGKEYVRLNGPVVFDHTDVTGLPGSTSFTFRIQPVKGQDSGARSPGVTVRTAPTPAARSVRVGGVRDTGIGTRKGPRRLARGHGGVRASARR